MTGRVIDLPVVESIRPREFVTADKTAGKPAVDGPEVSLPDTGDRLRFAVHRLPPPERTCPAWPRLITVESARMTRWRAWYRKAQPLPGWYSPWPGRPR